MYIVSYCFVDNCWYLAWTLLCGSSCFCALFTFCFGAALRHGQWPIRCIKWVLNPRLWDMEYRIRNGGYHGACVMI